MSATITLKTSAMIASFADPGQKTTPAPFGHALVGPREADPRIVGLTADLGKYTDMHIFAQAFPERFFQMGMAEQLLFGAAAGMAETGLVPFASTYSVFAARRAYDFICLDIAEPDLNVNVVGGLPGLTTGYGPSHQATEDMAIFRGMPGLTIVDPCDSVDIEQAVRNWPSTPDRPTCGYCGATYRPSSTSTTTASSWARPKCCATAPTWSSSPVGTDDDAGSAGRTTPCRRQRRRRRGPHPDHQTIRHGNRASTDRFRSTSGDAVRITPWSEGCSRQSPQRPFDVDWANRSPRSRCPTNSSPPARCPPCTNATACQRRKSSQRSSRGCNITVDS